ncbi:MAG TPA: phosphatase PAP2 family protein [Pirellulales bacterium]|nr:phosphatase PAP2 family protein [Pirellulales bacterium]
MTTERKWAVPHPADLMLVGILWTASLKGLVSDFPAAQRLGGLHFVFALVMSCVVAVDAGRRHATWWSRIRPWAMVAWIFTLYSTLGRLSVEAVGTDTFDPVLSRIDIAIFGFDPSFEIQRFLTPGRIEAFALAYAWFIPYIHLALFFNLEARAGANREQFLTAWTLLYTLSYLGYLFVPAFGPVAFPIEHRHVELEGGHFLKLVRDSVASSGGLFGVFPSLHVGCSVFLCYSDWSRDRLRSLMYVPIVLAIYGATIVLRYHYVIDLMVGTLLAFGTPTVGAWIYRRWETRR